MSHLYITRRFEDYYKIINPSSINKFTKLAGVNTSMDGGGDER